MREWERTAARAAVGATAAFAFVCAAVVWSDTVQRWDAHAVAWVHAQVPGVLVDASRVVTYAGSVLFLVPLALLAGAALLRRGYGRQAALVWVALAGSQLLQLLLKLAVRRARPRLDDPFVVLHSYSFPSGHATSSAAIYGALAVVAAGLAPRTGGRIAAALVAIVVVLLVGATRVVLGVHFPADVLGGVLAGVAWLGASIVLVGRPGTGLARRRAGGEPAARARSQAK